MYSPPSCELAGESNVSPVLIARCRERGGQILYLHLMTMKSLAPECSLALLSTLVPGQMTFSASFSHFAANKSLNPDAPKSSAPVSSIRCRAKRSLAVLPGRESLSGKG